MPLSRRTYRMVHSSPNAHQVAHLKPIHCHHPNEALTLFPFSSPNASSAARFFPFPAAAVLLLVGLVRCQPLNVALLWALLSTWDGESAGSGPAGELLEPAGFLVMERVALAVVGGDAGAKDFLTGVVAAGRLLGLTGMPCAVGSSMSVVSSPSSDTWESSSRPRFSAFGKRRRGLMEERVKRREGSPSSTPERTATFDSRPSGL